MRTLLIIWLACAIMLLMHRVYDQVKYGRRFMEMGTLLGALTAPITLVLAAGYGTVDWLCSDASLSLKQELKTIYTTLTKEE